MTRARHRRLGLAPVPCTGSGPPRKQPRRDTQRASGHSEASQCFTEDIAGRLLSVHAAEYIRFRAVCSPWRVSTDDPRACGALDSRFRPRGWTTLYPREPVLPSSIYQFSTHNFCGSTGGLIVLCDKTTSAIRLLNPLTGTRAEFPAITNVRLHDEAEPNARFLDMDALKGSFPKPGVIWIYGRIDDSTCPPTLLLSVKNGSWHIVGAKPGDEHWLSLRLTGLTGVALSMFNFINIGSPPVLDD
ncbi:unnamed protein product [Alopecurus aequalis]